jgi:phage terminase large subunit-like protein
LDLATTTDIAAFVLVFPGEQAQPDPAYALGSLAAANGGAPSLMSPGRPEPTWLLPFFWIPEANMRERVLRDRVPYDAWVRDGLVTATPGNVIDYGRIEAQIVELAQIYNIREIAFDRWGAAQITQNLTGAGLKMMQMGQGFASMSAPSKELLRLVLSQGIGHGGNPVLRWMADNVTAEQDAAGNVKPSKAKSRDKIDGIVASIMGLDRATRNAGDDGYSVYEERGIRTL